jgi:uncharacterized membrane protein/heat shock protein HslJ
MSVVVLALLTMTSSLSEGRVNNKTQGGISDNAYKLMLKKWKAGIGFYALGNEPFWSLDMDFEGVFHFNTLNGDDLKVPAVKGNPAMDAEVVRFRSVADQGELIIELTHERCDDTMSDDTYHYKVKVEYKPEGKSDYEIFRGCGNYVPNFLLNDIWAVVEVDGKKLNPKDFAKGMPRIEFHIKQENVSGSDGCNNFRGSVEFQYHSVIFGMLAYTRMYCPDMEVSERITGAISKRKLDFEFDEDGYLILMNDGKKVMKLRHID